MHNYRVTSDWMFLLKNSDVGSHVSGLPAQSTGRLNYLPSCRPIALTYDNLLHMNIEHQPNETPMHRFWTLSPIEQTSVQNSTAELLWWQV